MKKVIYLLLIFCLLQSFKSNAILTELVLIGGIGAAGISGSESWKDPVGVQFAAVTKILDINEKSSVNSGIGFTRQGAGWEEDIYSGRVNLSYVNVPVLYKHEISRGFYGELGLQPSLLLSAKDKYNGMTEDYKDSVKKFDLGLPIGVGYKINDQLSVGVRATFGLTNLDNTGSEISDHNYIVVGLVKYSINWPGKK